MVLGLVALLVRSGLDESRLAAVEEPERALALVVGRTMDAHVALADAGRWELWLYALTLADSRTDLADAITWYEELGAYSASPGVDLRLAVLLGEAGRREQLLRLTGVWRSSGSPLALHAPAVEAAYLGGGRPDASAVAATLLALGEGWFADVLAQRLEGPALPEGARPGSAARAGPLLWRLRTLTALDLTLVLLGVLVLRGLWRHPGQRPAVADAPLPPPWSLAAGLATLVRGAALGALIILGLLDAQDWLFPAPLLGEDLDQILAYLPVLVLIHRSLLAPAGLGFAAAFGLRPRMGSRRAVVQATLALVAAGIAIDVMLGLLSGRLGMPAHWAEWFDAELAWGSPAEVTARLLGSVLFAPVFEELIFRGCLYGSLRSHMGSLTAAITSSLVFGLAHGYGLVGFLSVLLSGLLWAWVYERTGSLLPCIVAHVVNNLLVALSFLVLLRWA